MSNLYVSNISSKQEGSANSVGSSVCNNSNYTRCDKTILVLKTLGVVAGSVVFVAAISFLFLTGGTCFSSGNLLFNFCGIQMIACALFSLTAMGFLVSLR